MSQVNCAPGGGRGRCIFFFFPSTLSWLPHYRETFQNWLWNKWFKETWGPVSSFQKEQRSFEKGFCSHCAPKSNSFAENSFAGNSRYWYHLTVQTVALTEQRLPSIRVTSYVPAYLIQLVPASDMEMRKYMSWKWKGSSSLWESDEARNKGWHAILKSLSLG